LQGKTPSEVIEPFVEALRSRVEIGARFPVGRVGLTRTAVVECGGEISLPRRNQGYQTTWSRGSSPSNRIQLGLAPNLRDLREQPQGALERCPSVIARGNRRHQKLSRPQREQPGYALCHPRFVAP
jgi:hypothetical protein